MPAKNCEQPVVRAFASQDAVDLVSDDDWDAYEIRMLQGSSSSSGPMPTPPDCPSKSSPQKRKRDEAGVPIPPEPASKRPRRGDQHKSGKSTATAAGSRTDPIAVPKEIVDMDADSTNSVVDRARVGPSGRCTLSSKPKPVDVRASSALLRSAGVSSTTGVSKLGASVDVADISPAHGRPKHPAVKEAEGNIPVAKDKGKPTGGLKLVRKKTKKQLEEERKVLELREKKMTRREFIQYLYEEKLKGDLEDAPPKQLVLKDRVIWYAEPGGAKASDSFDRKRYEMVCSVQVFWLPRSFSLQLVRHGATVVPDFNSTTVTHVIFPGYIKGDGQALQRMGYTKYSQIPGSIKTVSWNWASRSIELSRIVPEQPYERFEVRLPPKPVIPFRRNGARIVDSEDEDEDEEVYAITQAMLLYIDSGNLCSRPKGRIPHIGGAQNKLHTWVEQQPITDVATATEDPLLPFYTEAKKYVAEEEVGTSLTLWKNGDSNDFILDGRP
jgi:hypothetical protein